MFLKKIVSLLTGRQLKLENFYSDLSALPASSTVKFIPLIGGTEKSALQGCILKYSGTVYCPATKRQDDYQATKRLMIDRHLGPTVISLSKFPGLC